RKSGSGAGSRAPLAAAGHRRREATKRNTAPLLATPDLPAHAACASRRRRTRKRSGSSCVRRAATKGAPAIQWPWCASTDRAGRARTRGRWCRRRSASLGFFLRLLFHRPLQLLLAAQGRAIVELLALRVRLRRSAQRKG